MHSEEGAVVQSDALVVQSDATLPKAAKKPEQQQQQKLTEFFAVRRSVRKTKKTVLEEKQRCLEHLLRHRIEEGLNVQIFEGKGRGVVAAKPFEKGDFVVEYSGDLIDLVEAKKREQIYAQDHKLGCYMYYFKYKGQQYWCVKKIIVIKKKFKIFFFS